MASESIEMEQLEIVPETHESKLEVVSNSDSTDSGIMNMR